MLHIPCNLLNFSFEIRRDTVLMRKEQIQVVIFLCLIIVGHALPQKTKGAKYVLVSKM